METYATREECVDAAIAATRATGVDHVTVHNTRTGEWRALPYDEAMALPDCGWGAGAQVSRVRKEPVMGTRVSVYDSGAGLDRYTVVIEAGDRWAVRTASHNADSPLGVWQHVADGYGLPPRGYRDGTPVRDWPDGLRRAIDDYPTGEQG